MNASLLSLFAAGLSSLAFVVPCLLSAPLPEPALPDDAVSVQETQMSCKPQSLLLFADVPSGSIHSSGSWFLSIGAGTGFPQYDRGDVVNNVTGVVESLRTDSNMAFTGLLAVGYRWFDPERWGHWSFDADFVGAYLGVGISSFSPIQGTDHINLGFLGLRGRVGYRVAQDRFEPFIGFAAGGVIVNVESAGIDHGGIWGYWFAPTCGLRYYIPQTRWSISVEGLFRFLGGLNGFDGPGPGLTMNETSHVGLSGGWIYVPLGVMAIGYRF